MSDMLARRRHSPTASRYGPSMRRLAVGTFALVLLVSACSSSGSKSASQSDSSSSVAALAQSTTTTEVAPADVPAVPSKGCTGATPVAAGEVTMPFTAAGVDGSVIQHVPPAHDGTTPLPLVLDLHGYSEPASIEVLLSALGPYGDAHGFVTLTPETAHTVPMWSTALDSPDMKWLTALLDDTEARLCIDTARVFTTGLSNGAMMTSSVACALSDRVAAVAPVAGVELQEGCTPTRPVPLITFHGTADPYVAYDGGLGPKALELAAPDGSGKTLGDLGVGTGGGPTVPDIVAGWAARNGCASTPPSSEALATDVAQLTHSCPADASAELVTITDGGHTWPGSAFAKNIESFVGHTTESIDATAMIWAFFEAHPLRR
jgi:polyhydroxybutyrate depolymerase